MVTFVESHEFTADWSRLGLGDDDLSALQQSLGREPRSGVLVRGTGGLRKLRFAPAARRMGKRAAMRVCYAYYEQFGWVYLVAAYAKTEQADLSVAERKALRKLLERQRQALAQKQQRGGTKT